MKYRIPTLDDVYEARKFVSRYLPRTPLRESHFLSEKLECRCYIKYENLQPIGAFKVRGGVNLVSNLSEQERQAGLITASTGNHGQSIAFAGMKMGVKVIVCAPENCNPDKARAMRALGAEVVFHGKDIEESREWVEDYAARTGMRYVHFANEPLLIAGVATISLEVMEELPDVDIIVVPVGEGSGACGHCIVAKEFSSKVQVIGVQSEKAPAVYLAWKKKVMAEPAKCETFAEGLATLTSYELTQTILNERLDDFILVSDEEIRQAMVILIQAVHHLAEPAGAAAAAAALKIRPSLKDKKVVLILSGANVTVDTLKTTLAAREPQ